MSAEAHTSSEYIKHHLQNLTYGQLPDGSWGLAQTAAEAKDMGFWAINVDTMGFSIVLGVLFLALFHRVARNPTTGVPGGFQNFVIHQAQVADSDMRLFQVPAKGRIDFPDDSSLGFDIFTENKHLPVRELKKVSPLGIPVLIPLAGFALHFDV